MFPLGLDFLFTLLLQGFWKRILAFHRCFLLFERVLVGAAAPGRCFSRAPGSIEDEEENIATAYTATSCRLSALSYDVCRSHQPNVALLERWSASILFCPQKNCAPILVPLPCPLWVAACDMIAFHLLTAHALCDCRFMWYSQG